MRKGILLVLVMSAIAVFVSFAKAQQSKTNAFNVVSKTLPKGDSYSSDYKSAPTTKGAVNNFPESHLSPMVASVPNANSLPISSRYDVASNGRALHSLAVDPDDPMKLHFVAMELTDNSVADTLPNHFETSRRVVYSYSSNGGASWTSKLVSDVRMGYPDIILYKRGGVWVPIIAAHQGPIVTEPNDTSFAIRLFIEQGAPGDGNFQVVDADDVNSSGATNDFGFANLLLSPAQDTLYVLGCPVAASQKSIVPAPLEFGYFTLDVNRGAKWLGWKSRPGADLGDARAAGGEDVMHVSSSGKIGVLWAQADNTDRGLYYVESNDGGQTWTTPYSELYIPDQSLTFNDGGTGTLCDYNGMDFYFDQSGVPHFIWQMDYQELGANQFGPYSAMVCYWARGDQEIQILNCNAGFTPQFSTLSLDGNDVNATIEYQPSYFDISSSSSYEPTGIPYISTVSFAVASNDPKNVLVLYSTFQDNDMEDVDVNGDGSSPKTYLFRSIYFQQTTDGGQNWTDPEPFVANDPALTDPTAMLDFHFPSTSLTNPALGGSTNFNVNFLVDTFPGQQFGNGTAGWTFNTWYHTGSQLLSVPQSQSTTQSSLVDLGANYPNPVTASTTIPVTMIQSEMATLSIEDILGRTVKTVYSGILSAGDHRITVDASSLTAGIYRYTLSTASGAQARLMSVIK